MSNSNNLFDQIKDEFTREGEMFETRNIRDDKGFPITEYVSFPDNLKAILILEDCMVIKNF